MTAGFGPAGWDTSALDHPRVVDVFGGLQGDKLSTLAAVAAGRAPGDAMRSLARLGRAGVVAVRVSGRAFIVKETREGWELVASSLPTLDIEDLAVAARLRATRLDRERGR